MLHKYVPLYSIAFSKLINNINYFLSHELDKDLQYYDSLKLFSLPYAPKAHQIRSIMFNFHIYYWIWENSGTVHCYNANWKITHFEKRIHWKCVIFSKCSATVHVIPSIHVFKCWQRETIGLVDGYNRINQVISLQSININNIGSPYNKHLRKMDCVSFEIWFYFWKTDACFKLLY